MAIRVAHIGTGNAGSIALNHLISDPRFELTGVWVSSDAKVGRDAGELAGLDARTGSITPGKKADVVVIDGSAVNVAPVIDAAGAVVCAADISNVKHVLVDGNVVKRDFRLAASLDEPRKRVEASRDHLISKFGEPEAGWLTASADREVATA